MPLLGREGHSDQRDFNEILSGVIDSDDFNEFKMLLLKDKKDFKDLRSCSLELKYTKESRS